MRFLLSGRICFAVFIAAILDSRKEAEVGRGGEERGGGRVVDGVCLSLYHSPSPFFFFTPAFSILPIQYGG